MSNTFYTRLRARWKNESYVCIGLDIDMAKLPAVVREVDGAGDRVFLFAKTIIEATHEYACAFKLNSAHFEAMGAEGYIALKKVIDYIKTHYPTIVVILDAKRGDIANTNEYYARAVFDELGADTVTVHPYMGQLSLAPFLSRRDKGVIVMGANSAEGAAEFQDLVIGTSGEPLYVYVCRSVAERWNSGNNCAVTASALDVHSLATIRGAVGEMPILLLGVGAQGGVVDECVDAGRATRDIGLIINASRSILYASSDKDYAQAAAREAERLNKSIIAAL